MADIERIQRAPSTPSSGPSKKEGGVSLDTGKTGEQINTLTQVAETVTETPTERPTTTNNGSVATTTQKVQTTTTTTTPIPVVQMPDTEEELRKVLHTEIKKKIDTLMKHAIELQRNPTAASARNLVDVVNELRKLTIMMKSLWQLTVDKLKELYHTFFPSIGK